VNDPFRRREVRARALHGAAGVPYGRHQSRPHQPEEPDMAGVHIDKRPLRKPLRRTTQKPMRKPTGD
jgi:hypothetical protein